MDGISNVAQAAVGDQADATANAMAVSMMKAQSAMEKQVVQMIVEATKAALLPPGQGTALDLSV